MLESPPAADREGERMSRRVWFASACLLAGTLALGVFAGPASADETTPTPSPTPTATSSGLPLPILPTPTPSTTLAAPVTALTAAAESGSLVVSWRTGAGDTGFTVEATAGGTTKRVDTTATTASFPGIRPGAVIRISVIAHNAAGDASPVLTTFTMPAAIAPVTGAAMRATATGLEVAWRPPSDLAPGSRFLVELVQAGSGSRSRLVAASPVTFTALTSGRLYSATITVVSGTSRSAAVDVSAEVWTASASGAPVPVAPVPVASAARSTATAAADPAIAQPAAQRTLVSSPMAAAALAGAAVLLGGLAIGLLLRRPRRS